jgi:hypothetical protein
MAPRYRRPAADERRKVRSADARDIGSGFQGLCEMAGGLFGRRKQLSLRRDWPFEPQALVNLAN